MYDLGIIAYSDAFNDAKSRLLTLTRQVRDSDRDGCLVSVLVEGPAGSGKTAVVADLAIQAGFGYVKMVSPDSLIQYGEQQKVAKLSQVFDDAYKTKLAMILVDDVERLLEFANIGSSVRFSNMVLQALMVLLKRRPPSKCRLMVVVTTSIHDQMQLLGLDRVFYSIVGLSMLNTPDQISCVLQAAASTMPAKTVDKISKSIKQIPVKHLLNALETACQECHKDVAAISVGAFLSAVCMTPGNSLHEPDEPDEPGETGSLVSQQDQQDHDN